MNNAQVKQYSDRWEKVKTSERSKNIQQEEATHFSDAADKIVYTKYNEYRLRNYFEGFEPSRIG